MDTDLGTYLWAIGWNWWIAFFAAESVLALVERLRKKDVPIKLMLVLAVIFLVGAPYSAWRESRIELHAVLKDSQKDRNSNLCHLLIMSAHKGNQVLEWFDEDGPPGTTSWEDLNDRNSTGDNWARWSTDTAVEIGLYNKVWEKEFDKTSPEDWENVERKHIEAQLEQLTQFHIRAGCP
jgi:hypothetical protein